MFIELDVWNIIQSKSEKRLIHVDTIKRIWKDGDTVRLWIKGQGNYPVVEQSYEWIKDKLDNVSLLVNE